MHWRTKYGMRIMPLHVDLYERARALLHSPISANPEQRQRRQYEFANASEALHSALGRQSNQEDVMTVDPDEHTAICCPTWTRGDC